MRLCAAFLLFFTATSSMAADDQVTMNLKEFLALYEKSKAEKEKPEVSPRHFSIASVSHKGKVVLEDEVPRAVVFDATYAIEVHRTKGWVRVPVLPSGVVLQSAKLNGKEAPVVFEKNEFRLVTDKKGKFNLDLRFVVPVKTQKGQSEMYFRVMPMGANRVELELPGEEVLDVTIVGGHDKVIRTVRGKRVVMATAPTKGNMVIRWQQKLPDAEIQEPRIYSEVQTLVSVADGLLQSKVSVNQTILYAGVNQFRVALPKGAKVIRVNGQGLRDWDVTDENTLAVNLNYKAENRYQFDIELEQVLGDQTLVAAPLVQPLGVERSKGWMGVEAVGNLEIQAGEVKGATPVDVRTLPAVILGRTQNPVLLGYKYLGDDAAIPLKIQEHDDVDVLLTLVDQVHATTMMTGHGRRLTSVRYEVRNNRRQFLRVRLPENAELWSAGVGGKAVQPAKAGDALLLPLLRSSQMGRGLASFEVEVVFVENGAAPTGRNGSFAAQLPVVDVPSTYVAWSIYASDHVRVSERSIETSLRHVDDLSEPLGSVDALNIQSERAQMQHAATGVGASGGLDKGATPVKVRLPVEGVPYHFEKILALDETLSVDFDFKLNKS